MPRALRFAIGAFSIVALPLSDFLLVEISAMSNNLNAVQAIYEAFGKGDIPSILERLSEAVRWERPCRWEWGLTSWPAPGAPPGLRSRDETSGAGESVAADLICRLWWKFDCDEPGIESQAGEVVALADLVSVVREPVEAVAHREHRGGGQGGALAPPSSCSSAGP